MNLKHYQTSYRPNAVEICGNGIDDDQNGLTDEKDFSCYYSNTVQAGCIPSKIIWGASGSQLYWGDVETGEIRLVGDMNGFNIIDITWASNGKLYAVERAGNMIWEINPYTGFATPALPFPDYILDNALTSDSVGNLYIPGKHISTPTKYGILKINIATRQVTEVADLKPSGLGSAGDLCFLNGRLYLACSNRKMAIINISTGAIESYPLLNSSTPGSYGLVTLGDGYLYQSDKDKIYQIDPVTMKVASTPYFDFKNKDIGFSGLCSYTEHCNAPVCKASLDINIISNKPYCSASGVLLKGNGTGIRGDAVYKWTLPNKDTVRANELTAWVSGMYYLTYSGVTDYCGAKDSVRIDIITSPEVNLGSDTILCAGDFIALAPEVSHGITDYKWQDGSITSQFSIRQGGTYSLTVSNSCGSAVDTIIIAESKIPVVDIGADTLICPGSTISIQNYQPKQPWDIYKWNDGSSGETISVRQEVLYWLESSNSCGVDKDTVLVIYKDSCTCFPLYPQVDLGNDVHLCSYETIKLKNLVHQNGFKYTWQNGSTNSSFDAKDAGIYWVDVSTYCGTARDSIVITPKTSGCERKVMVPTAFTPDDNGTNDIFKPVVFGVPAQYEFIIYNRWGEIVFHTTNTGEGWNGTIAGKKQDTGTYVWTCSFRFEGEKVSFQKGMVTLIR